MRVNIGFPVVRTDGRAYGHVITKFSRMGRLPHFLSYGARSTRALRAGGAPLLLLLLFVVVVVVLVVVLISLLLLLSLLLFGKNSIRQMTRSHLQGKK